MLRKCLFWLLSAVLLTALITPGCAPDLSLGEGGLRFCQASAECVQRLGANFECRMRLCQRITASCNGAGAPCDVPGAKGVCVSGRTRCQGTELICEPVNTKQPKETCGNQLDDDCDGIVDNPDVCTCQPGASRPCYPTGLKGCSPDSTQANGFKCTEPCAVGIQVCETNAVWSTCSNPTTPGQEFCDGKDNDCNGQIDDTFPNKGDVCRVVSTKGPCESGVIDCDKAQVICKQTTQPSKEICNGKDDDCDGLVDNDPSCVCKPGETQECYTGPAGTDANLPCKKGTQKCVGGQFSACEGEVKPQSETCDGVDNNCNGQVDETFPGKDSPCVDSNRQGVCAAGTKACVGGKEVCSQTTQSSSEICDGKDNDCDGQIDNRQGQKCTCKQGDTRKCYTGPANTRNKAPCKEGSQTCQADGTYGACTGEVTPKTEECDGQDNNCNGQIDESFPELGNACTIGTLKGICATGKLACVSGRKVCEQTTSPALETCDGKDNDCDGNIDNITATPCYSGTTGCTKNGSKYDCVGECKAGVTACSGLSIVCSNEVLPGSDTTANGKDEDCDGTDGPATVSACTNMTGAQTWDPNKIVGCNCPSPPCTPNEAKALCSPGWRPCKLSEWNARGGSIPSNRLRYIAATMIANQTVNACPSITDSLNDANDLCEASTWKARSVFWTFFVGPASAVGKADDCGTNFGVLPGAATAGVVGRGSIAVRGKSSALRQSSCLGYSDTGPTGTPYVGQKFGEGIMCCK